MKRILSFALVALIGAVVSCKKISDEGITPQQTSQLAKCPLKNVNSATGTPIASFEYTLNRIKRIVNKEDGEVDAIFTYNIKNQIEKMTISNGNALETYTVTYVYDVATGKVSKTRTSVKDYEFQVNDFVYAGDKLITINTTLNIFGYTVKGTSRVEYLNDNVSKVYTKMEGEPELLAYEGLNYDTKAQFYPDGYRTMAYGFIGLANSYFAFFGQNNATSIKIYDDNGKVDEAIETVYEYNKTGIPTKGTKTITKGENKTTQTVAYQYMCN
ncbi:hypothetical protein GCM10011514_46990 [Emticicia aquatilis]|uniref:DUF4595 domain-containing protein n=1 Tax=Emticicia aquatilis TaxID=1537369 RepID=A0A916Z628_9BACT|nr:hypothetical protein [Emticicia aquatilis]GGD77676.1 hypothetical protein GCM10011514_46990 [Emticicia aquatilis]